MAVLLIALKERRFSFVRQLKLAPGILAAVAIVALWLIPANNATGGDFIRVGLGHHVLDRAFAESMEGHSGPFVYYLVLLPLTFAPWFAFLPLSIRRMWQSPNLERSRLFLFAWAVAPFLVFSFLKTKLPHYVLPAFPALAIITAYGLDAAIRERESLWKHWTGKLGIILLVIAAVGAIAGLIGFPIYASLNDLKTASLGPALLLCAILYLFLKDVRQRRNSLVAVDLAAGMLLLVLVLTLVYLPTMDKQSAPYRLAKKIKTFAHPGTEIYSIGYKEPTLVFYAQRPVQFASNWDRLPKNSKNALYIVTEKNMKRIPAESLKTLHELDRFFAFVPTKGKWMTWTFLAPDPAVPSQQ
jgi:4-amino-4-deoxy-L-arabinose transferase-like glycosyltransferase